MTVVLRAKQGRQVKQIICGALAVLGQPHASAQETSTAGSSAAGQPPAGQPLWSFRVTSYVWFAGLDGKVRARGQVADIDIDFSEVFDAIDWFPPPVMFVGEVRYDRFAFLTDFIYLGLEGDGTGPGGLLSAELDMSTIVWTFGGAYRVVQNDPVTLDLLAGGRLWNLDAEVTIAALGGALRGSDSKTWVDPIIGIAGQINLGDGFAIAAEGDVGGFGVAADLDWQVVGTVQYHVDDSIALEAGYRYLAVDYDDDDGFLFDVAMHGPIIGASFRF
jgi:opacity protein-like surface antigen